MSFSYGGASRREERSADLENVGDGTSEHSFERGPVMAKKRKNRVPSFVVDDECEGDDGDDELLLYAVTPGGQRILICWKCCGFDHTKERCPSKRRTSKSADVKIHDPSFGSGGQSAAKGRGGGVRDRFYARRGKKGAYHDEAL